LFHQKEPFCTTSNCEPDQGNPVRWGWSFPGSQHQGAGKIAAHCNVRKLVDGVTLDLIRQLYQLSCQFLTRIATYFREKTALLRSAFRQLFLSGFHVVLKQA